ncbi:hypothetical protein CYLTODRAFT_426486 [Cylindrobasidium torrendii FP15055 ss-10]|uniref:Uncharacterized protein n=1 Tax=Cylindrobasidium torrendii FP15055 ss-10 TaxID=1314674 RepID=A0A0D7AYM0_9AGAR|nr:hypothetical protein CYLTODRAFT_426486 [Cylindrobasidium torrendii FP15055 ss-10]
MYPKALKSTNLTSRTLCRIIRPTYKPNFEPVTITNVEPIGSYSWGKQDRYSEPAIHIPGTPPLWVEPTFPLRLPRTTQKPPSTTPSAPQMYLLPMIAAVPFGFKWGNVDIVIGLSVFRALIVWLIGKPGIFGAPDQFSIDLDLAGRSLLFSPSEESSTQRRSSARYLGIGERFERHATKSTEFGAHHRIITYNMGGLSYVMRFQVDASLVQVRKTPGRKAHLRVHPNLRVIHDWQAPIVPASCLVEIKTRRVDMPWTPIETYIAMLLSQSPNLHTAYYDLDGVFHSCKKISLLETPRILNPYRGALQRLSTCIGNIRDTVLYWHRRRGLTRFRLVCEDGELYLQARGDASSGVLPDRWLKVLRGRWAPAYGRPPVVALRETEDPFLAWLKA